MRIRVVAALAVALAGLLAGPLPVSPAAVAVPAHQVVARTTWSLLSPLARETVRDGATDLGVHHIAHVLELQLRLRRAHLYTAALDGVFGHRTEHAVRAFQEQAGLPVSGVVGRRTWARLIEHTTHLRVPQRCRAAGWHMCVDRKHHEATLFHGGALYNSWLVRGGAATTPTRLGTHRVFLRDINHVSNLFGTPMPYAQFFDGGEALHGSVMMTNPYVGHSHGCVNLYLEDARQLWRLTSTKRLVVTVHGAWD